jgi:hypothetical protein
MTGKKLNEYIFKDTGGNSFGALREIIRPAELLALRFSDEPYENIRKMLENHLQ